MNRLSRLVVPFLLVAAILFPVLAQAQVAGAPIYWKPRQLTWVGTTSKTHSFTASITDTAFVQLPADVAWDVMKSFSGANAAISVLFVTSTMAANADTVHYTFQYFVSGVTAYTDTRDHTPAITNCATRILANSAAGVGRAFLGQLNFNSATPSAEAIAAWGNLQLRVTGDPNGALANLQCWVYYPSRNPN
jgi:phosphotransferase system  glucose/maltose/N-acetylglucosamine-specific IIC component